MRVTVQDKVAHFLWLTVLGGHSIPVIWART